MFEGPPRPADDGRTFVDANGDELVCQPAPAGATTSNRIYHRIHAIAYDHGSIVIPACRDPSDIDENNWRVARKADLIPIWRGCYNHQCFGEQDADHSQTTGNQNHLINRLTEMSVEEFDTIVNE